MEKTYLVVGIGVYTSKKTQKESRILHLSTAFNDIKYGTGAQVSTEWISLDKYKESGVKVGDTIELYYGRSFDGRAYVNGLHVIESGDVPTIKKL